MDLNSLSILSYLMEHYIQGCGTNKQTANLALEYRFGLMGLNMKDIGKKGKLMVKADSFLLMETSMKESGKMIKHMERASILILMALSTVENGLMISKRVMEGRIGQMDHRMKASIKTERNKDLGNLFGQMVLNTKACGIIIKCMGQVSLGG
jgi:hypothetical protein